MTLHAVFLATLLAVEPPSGPTTVPPVQKEQSVYDVDHEKADLPGPGEMIADPKSKDVVYYFTNRFLMWNRKANTGKLAGLYVSKDGGKTWRLQCHMFEFHKLFIHPDSGRLFAIIGYEWIETDPKDGMLQQCSSNKVISSADGRRWKDITGERIHIAGLRSIFKDPDNAGRVCMLGGVIRGYVFQAKDDEYTDWNWLREDRPEGERLLESIPPKK
jgi:hypothetical protein